MHDKRSNGGEPRVFVGLLLAGLPLCSPPTRAQTNAPLIALDAGDRVTKKFPVAGEGEDKRVTQTAGVDNTRMGAYRGLAQLSFQAFQNGDNATAAELARILERTWDAAEGGGGDRSLVKANKDLFGQIDHAMDVFIKPVMNFKTKAPDPAAVQAPYNDFLEKLKQAE